MPDRHSAMLAFAAMAVALAIAACGTTEKLPPSTSSSNAQATGKSVLQVNNNSMGPEFKIGDVIEFTHADRAEVGDVVVFNPPGGFDTASCGVPREGAGARRACSHSQGRSSTLLIKRVVAVGGDKIAIRDGRTIRNGVPADEPSARPCHVTDLCDFPDAITVPTDSYYLLGDDRGASFDSRLWGAVPTAYIIGKVTGKR